MSLTYYYHPLSSFCMKTGVALYENGTPVEAVIVNFGDPVADAHFKSMWPVGKFPLLKDDARDALVPESSIIIEYLDQHYPGKIKFIPADPDAARRTRFLDRFFDNHIHIHMQKIVGDCLRAEGQKDPVGVADARTRIKTAYGMLEQNLEGQQWAMGDDFTMADCAAAPALFYGGIVEPLTAHPNIAAYLERLRQRPSFARVLKEAEPYFQYFPYKS